MNDLRTAAQQALEALEWHYRQGHSNTLGGLRLKIDEKALRNLKAALAEPVQEPVAWMCADESMVQKGYSRFSRTCNGEWRIPVYTAPTPRTPLRRVTYVCPVCAASLERQE